MGWDQTGQLILKTKYNLGCSDLPGPSDGTADNSDNQTGVGLGGGENEESVLVLEVDMDSVGNETWFDKEVQYCF